MTSLTSEALFFPRHQGVLITFTHSVHSRACTIGLRAAWRQSSERASLQRGLLRGPKTKPSLPISHNHKHLWVRPHGNL